MIQRTLDHIQEHLDLLRTTDPNMLVLVQEQPLGPPQGSPIAEGPNNAPAPSNVPGQAPGTMDVGPMTNMQDAMTMPSIPAAPGPFEGAPVLASDIVPES